MEYLVTMTTRVSEGTPADEVDHLGACEARTHPGPGRTGSPGSVVDAAGIASRSRPAAGQEADQMREILRSLPPAGWLTTEPVPLTRDPNHPGSVGA
jgi:muconolactone delta-isomerase